MFQNAWSSKTNVNSSQEEFPSNFVKRSEIKYIRTIYWDEHCLECSAPACYSTCPLYVKRADGACRRFEYGIRVLSPLRESLWRVKLQYRKWAKIEARINDGCLSPDSISIMDSKDKRWANVYKHISKLAGCRFSRRYDGLRRKKYAEIKSQSRFVSDFLFQCRYDGAETFTMFLEIADKNNQVIFKYGLKIKNGYNQKFIKLDFSLPTGGLVRLYPENNLNVELEIYAADFVEMQNSYPDRPAEKIKCVAWDLDNTIWKGILAEANPAVLELRENVLDTILEFDRRGIIQVIVSKNDREAVLPVLERLNIKQYFIYIFANWNPKSDNIFYAARMLNIGLDTFCLIDDSKFERSEVHETLPCVRTYDENKLDKLFELSEFDVPVTEDGAKRRISYQQEASRKQIKDIFGGSNIEFIRNCQINLTISHISTPEHRKRSLELLLRTNQLNLSAHRYTEQEFDELLKDSETSSLILFVNDRFGDYGQVAFLQFRVENNTVTISEYAMSCRVAAKLVENALFKWMQRYYNKDIEVRGVKTNRNGTLVDALTKTGFTSISDSNEKIRLYLPLTKKIENSDCINAQYKK